MFLRPILASLTLSLCCFHAMAAVNPQNGKYSQEFTFFSFPNDIDSRLPVAYNSMTQFHGIFGWGFGSDLETRLHIIHNEIVITEYGEGADNRFTSTLRAGAKSLQEDVNELVTLTKQTGVYWSPGQLEKFKIRLQSDPIFRQEQWTELRRLGKVKDTAPAVGAEYVSEHFGHQVITRIEKGFLRQSMDGHTQLFSEHGRLKESTGPDGNTRFIKYSEAGRILGFSQSNGPDVDFICDEQGFVIRIESGKKTFSTFSYDTYGNLVKATMQDGPSYDFKYNAPMHLVTQITEASKLTWQLFYYPLKDKNSGWVHEFKDADGTDTVFEYGGDISKPGFYEVGIQSESRGGKSKAQSKTQYFTRVNEAGELVAYRVVSNINGNEIETTYNDCCHLPTHIKSGKDEVFYEYDGSGLVVSKKTKDQLIKISYDAKCSLPKKVTQASPSHWTTMSYNGKCLPASGQDSNNKAFSISYDEQGRAQKIKFGGKNQRQFILKYAQGSSQPIEIDDSIQGSVKAPDEIKKLLSLSRETISPLMNDIVNSQSI